MAKKKLYKSKMNFTLKRLHQSGSYGKIFERDYTTVVSQGTSPEGQIPVYTSPSFKMTVSVGSNRQKKYHYGEWLNNPNSCGDNNTWTLDCMPFPNTNDSKIILKPNSKRLNDFVCYSSAYELIKSSVSDIIMKFPAEMYVTNRVLKDTGIFGDSILNKNSDLYKNKSFFENYYVIDNPLMVDILQATIPEDSNVDKLRFFCDSFKDYEFIDEQSSLVKNIEYWEVNGEPEKNCIVNGDKLATVILSDDNGNELIKIYCYYYKNNIIYISNKRCRIRPNRNRINMFFDKLDDFQKILLNQYTGYTAKFEAYEENDEDGWYYIEKKYKWPTTDGGWNLSIKGVDYNNYLDSLIKLAYGYDELYTNAIWRMMTHEAISNMDLTINKNGEDVNPNSSKIKKMLNIIGRQFDEIKKYADNIKNSNNITYEQEKNTPDYFLSDNLDLSGWEVKEILKEIPNNEITEPMYGARTIGFSASDANNEFLRRLNLNSKKIFSKKGTKQAIEDLLGLFGLHSTDWLKKYYGTLNDSDLRNSYILVENVYIVKGYGYNKTPEETLNEVKRVNQLKDNFNIDDLENDTPFDYFQGIPVTEANLNGVSRLIPWFDRDKEYDSKIYFQSKGGWSKNNGYETYIVKNTTLQDVIENDEYYEWDENEGVYELLENKPSDSTTENTDVVTSIPENKTKKYLKINCNVKVVNVLPELKIKNYKYLKYNNNYYIWDKVSFNGFYEQTISKINFVNSKQNLFDLAYNTLKENDLYYVNDEDKYYKIYNIEKHTENDGWIEITDVNEILKYENTVDTNKGNNPHTGDYDSGENYIDAFQKIFEKSTFNNTRTDSVQNFMNFGFDIEVQPDSNKCLFFDENQTLISSSGNLRGSRIKPHNFFDETDINGSKESAALSIINSKELHIVFDISNKNFIEKDVLPYIKQLIPSTTIFSYSFEYIESDEEIFDARIEEKICSGNSCPLLGIIEE